MSIDEMIKAGKTFTEIQTELRKQVAARDEEQLQKARIEKARSAVSAAMLCWYKTLGLSFEGTDEQNLLQLINNMLTTQEKEINKVLVAQEKEINNSLKKKDFKDLLSYIYN